MTIFVLTENSAHIEKINKSLGKHYELSFMNSMDKFLKLFSGDNNVELDTEECVVVLLEYDLYIKYDIASYFKKDEVIPFSPVLLCNNVGNIELSQVLDTRTSLMMSLDKITNKELLIQIQLLIHNFYKMQQIQNYAFFDLLTKIGNRRTFMKNLELYFKHYQHHKTTFCLAMIDLDNFKSVNDNFGHLKGDEILAIAANIMQNNCRKTDMIARVGGEEFAIIFPQTELKQAHDVLERIRSCVERTTEEDEAVKVTMSAGLVKVREDYKEYTDLISNVDLLLYKAKDLGRNRICM